MKKIDDDKKLEIVFFSLIILYSAFVLFMAISILLW